MAFVKVKDIKGLICFVDPEKVTGYTIQKRAKDCHDVMLDAGSTYTQLWNPDNDLGGWETAEAAQEYVENWFVAVMSGVRELKRQREAVPPHRIPNVGDVYRIFDNYWEITGREAPGDTGVSRAWARIILEPAPKVPGGLSHWHGLKHEGAKTMVRDFPWWDAHAQLVGSKEKFLEAARQLLGSFYHGEESLPFVLDGFTGHEGMTVHYALTGAIKTYCCHRDLPLSYGQVISDNEHAVTCSQFDRDNSYQEAPPKGLFRVVHYALPQDNSPRCCGATYPLPEDEIWMADKRHVTCPEFEDDRAPGSLTEVIPCGSTEPHAAHKYGVDNGYECDGVSSGDDA